MSPPNPGNRRLTDKAYWDSKYAAGPPGVEDSPPSPAFIRAAKRLLGAQLVEGMGDYRAYLLWEVIYRRHMPRGPGVKVLEVGSAPGTHLVHLHRVCGVEPYGVEYTERGVLINRQLFEKHGINPDNVIHADFFSPEFQSKYEGFFDVVISRGFIEHFTDMKTVVANHVSLLTKHGRLFVTIPNLRGINYALTWFFHKELIPLHNIGIMRRQVFCRLFHEQRLSPLLCGYYGTFSFDIHNTKEGSVWRRRLLLWCGRFQRVLNLVFRLLFRARGVESSLTSPHLIFIGTKTD
jgi:SAM-dependent methyltransferase